MIARIDNLRSGGALADESEIRRALKPLLKDAVLLREADDRWVYRAVTAEGQRLLLKRARGACRAVLCREFDCLRALSSSSFPAAYLCVDEDEHDETILIREYIEGVSLADYAGSRALGWREAARIGARVCTILRELHKGGSRTIYRDLKADNIIRSDDGSLVLVDFGTAQAASSSKRTDTVLIMTPETAAPEQFGYQRSDERTDVYGLGMLMTCLLTGAYDPRLLAGHAMPRALRRLIARCLRFDPAHRPHDMRSVERALNRLQSPLRRRLFHTMCAAALLVAIALAALNSALPVGLALHWRTTIGVAYSDPELARAVELGIGGVRSDNPQVSADQFALMLSRMIRLVDPDKMTAFQVDMGSAMDSSQPLSRADGFVMLFFAARAIGGSAAAWGDWHSLNDTIGLPWDDYKPSQALFSMRIYSERTGDQYSDFIIHAAAYFFALAKTSRFSGRNVFDYDSATNSMRTADPLTYEEALLAAVRLYDSVNSQRKIHSGKAVEKSEGSG